MTLTIERSVYLVGYLKRQFRKSIRWFTVVNNTVWDLRSVALKSRNLAVTGTLNKKKHLYKQNSSSCDSNLTYEASFERSRCKNNCKFKARGHLGSWPKSHISNIGHDGILSFSNFMLMVKKHRNLNFEPLHFIGLGHDPAKLPKFQ
jgi:hypothetical protein